MLKLKMPTLSYKDSIDSCEMGINGTENKTKYLKERLVLSKKHLINLEDNYITKAKKNELHKCRVWKDKNNPIIIGCLSKDDLGKLYTNYLVPKKKPARNAIYDEIMNEANEECPFCGGIGVPNNLDHFLPKTYFPQYSLLPCNLVPSCENCNMGAKGQAYATTPENQFIHPYLDKDHLFSKQWIYASFKISQKDKNCFFKFFVDFDKIEQWSEECKSRVNKHFNSFNMEKKYSIQASRDLKITFNQLEKMLDHKVDKKDIIAHLLQPKIESAPHINHWIVPTYQALIKWFRSVEMDTLEITLGFFTTKNKD